MSNNFGRCIICTLPFELGDVSALKCGHTYHNECITIWINSAHNCPKCRSKNTVRDIKKLFIDEPDNSIYMPELQTNSEMDAKLKNLESQIKDLKDAKTALEFSLQDTAEKSTRLTQAVEKEKQESAKRLKLKDTHIRQLECVLEDQNVLREEIRVLKSRIKACEFYSLLLSKSPNMDEAEIGKAIDGYSAASGDPNTGEFLKLIRRQMKKTEKKCKYLGECLRNERLENNMKDLEIARMRDEIQVLHDERQAERRKRHLTSSEDLLPSTSMQRAARPSFGFSSHEEFNDSDIQVISGGGHSSKPAKHLDQSASCQIIEVRKTKNPPQTRRPFTSISNTINNNDHKKKKNALEAKSTVNFGHDLSDLITPKLLAHANNENEIF